MAPAATLQTAARPGPSSPGPGALPSPEGLGLLHIFHRAATAANSKELSLPPEPVVPWPLTLNLTETQGSPAASQPGVGRKDGCEPDVPGLAPLPTFAHFCESTGSLHARPRRPLLGPPSRRPALPGPPAWQRGPRALCPALVTREWGGQGAYLRMCATSWVVRGLSSTLLEPVGQKPRSPRRGVPPPGEARPPASRPRVRFPEEEGPPGAARGLELGPGTSAAGAWSPLHCK